ncbi:MAG TPA: sulfate adenylyltransferase [Gammaproteobacteria bacterium]|nr:sulfate adenylyltransferase [Gammaproteobacteria bacterium]
MARHSRLLCLLLTILLLPASADWPALDDATLQAVTQRHGALAADRLRAWQALIDDYRDQPLHTQLQATNDFFNRLEFVDDIVHWRRADYWATPVEFLTSGGGDCEDFAIAKYFTLLEMGVPESRLQITYVKALRLSQAHMVLAYYANPAADPLVLDNLAIDVLPGSARSDLVPVYSFNGYGLWLSKARGRSQRVGGAERLSLWQDLKSRLAQQRASAGQAFAQTIEKKR